jgi:pyruvate dehydrogenase E2 component (dihydrolipoamide acetyltransferase)
MTESKQQIPHFYVTHEFDMGPVMALRSQLNLALEGDGIKLSVNDFVVRAVSLSVRGFPNLNASLAGDQVIHRGNVNVGVAVAVEGGLLTIVCHNADQKSIRQISTEVREKAERARDGKVRPDDIEGSTITISNLGMYDVEEFIAIINPPDVAILAVGSVKDVPVVENGEVRIGSRMRATLSVDHRVSDGAEAARYLQALAMFLEEPLRLLI